LLFLLALAIGGYSFGMGPAPATTTATANARREASPYYIESGGKLFHHSCNYP